MADLMIGILKAELCDAGGTPASIGSLKSGSLTLKPQYKEHKSGFPQITDIKVPEVITGTFKFDCEEIGLIKTLAGAGVAALGAGVPHNVDVKCEAPTAQGGAFQMDGSGYIKGVSGQVNANDFGTMSVEVDCVPMGGAGGAALITFTNVAGAGTSTIAAPSYTHQQLTSDSNNLSFGTPTVAKGAGAASNCRMFNFNATGNFKYHTSGFPPVIDLAIMESNEFTLSAEFEDPAAVLLTDALAALTPGAQPVKNVTVNATYQIIGGTDVVVSLKNAMVEPDLSFNPGNDWNGVTVKCTALLPVGSLPTSGWALTIA